MGNLIFPSLPGIALGMEKSPVWSTIPQRSSSLREIRISLAASPLYNFSLPIEFLRKRYRYSELQTLMGFVNKLRGAWDSFLYLDPTDNFARNVLIGTGDGVNKSFQLTRSYGGFSEAIANPNLSTVSTDPLMWDEDLTTGMWAPDLTTGMWLPGSALGPFTISAAGVLTFTTAPALDTPVYWSGFFYYRCRMLDDTNDFKQQLVSYWSMDSLKFVGNLGTKI